MHFGPSPLGQVLHGWMHPFLFGLNLAWPTPERTRSRSRSRNLQMAAPGRRKMQFPFSIFHMRIKRLFHISICQASCLHGAVVLLARPTTIATWACKHIKINIWMSNQKEARLGYDSGTEGSSGSSGSWQKEHSGHIYGRNAAA